MADGLLGDFHVMAPGSRVAGIAVLAFAMTVTVLLQRVQLALGRDEAAVWWASNGRDLINGVSLALIGLALWFLGYPGPVALVVGATALLLLNLFENFLLRWPGLRNPTLLALLVAFALAAPLVAAPAGVYEAVTRAAQRLFG